MEEGEGEEGKENTAELELKNFHIQNSNVDFSERLKKKSLKSSMLMAEMPHL